MQTLQKYIERIPSFEQDMLNSIDIARTFHQGKKTEVRAPGHHQDVVLCR
jgi:hypothetical protein